MEALQKKSLPPPSSGWAVLSGRNAPDGGSVAINGEDLHAHFESLKRDIAVVPQKDVLHDSLSLGTALRYTAELRLPPNTRRHEIESRVSAILDVVGLSQRRATLIRHLSGGQVKRASLANELMAGPSLLFVDEATSGLDEQTDREMMELFDKAFLVFLQHAPAVKPPRKLLDQPCFIASSIGKDTG